MPVTVLLVEDFNSFRSFVAGLLRDVGYVVREAGDGAEGIAIALEFRPDLVLMDIGLPCVNGFEAARQILEDLPSSKIVFLTRETDQEIVQEALALGAAGYITKHRVQSELLEGLAAVSRSERFLSSDLRRCGNSDSTP